MLLLALIIYRQSANTVTALNYQAAKQLTASRSDIVSQWLQGNIRELQLIAEADELRPLSWSSRLYLKKMLKNRKYFSALWFADTSGTAWTFNVKNPPFSVYDRPYFQKLVVTRETDVYVTNSIFGRASNTVDVYIICTIKNAVGKPTGILGATVNLNSILSVLDDKAFGSRYGFIVDGTGEIIAHPDPGLRLKLKIGETNKAGYQGLDSAKNVMAAGQAGSLEFIAPDRTPYIAVYAPIGSTPNWSLGIAIPRAEFMNISYDLLKTISFAFLLMLIIILFISHFISAHIARPLQQLARAADAVSGGDLSDSVALPASGTDEIGRLAKIFGVMRGSINMTLHELEIRNLSLQTEIAERRQAQEKLAASEEKFSKAFSHVADIIGIIRLEDGCYIDVNEAFTRILGYTREEIVGNSTLEIGLWQNEEDYNAVYDVMREKGYLYNRETTWLTKSGEPRTGMHSGEVISLNGEKTIIYIWHDLTEILRTRSELEQSRDNLEQKVTERTLELFAANQELTAINVTLNHTNNELQKEISERRRMESELPRTLNSLNAAQLQLLQSEKLASLGNLVAGVAHEINTPVGVGITAASYLQQEIDNIISLIDNDEPHPDLVRRFETLKESSNIVLKNLVRAGNLISSFKQVSIDQSSDTSRTFKVKEYLEEIILSLHHDLKKTKHLIRLECDAALILNSYPGSWAQILTNLIMNFLIHAYGADDAGTIRISVRQEGDVILLMYSDDGCGIDFEIQPKIFDPFFTTKRNQGGTGLGLSIVYSIVTQRLNGTITCESSPKEGTAFIIRLPLLPQ
jgi:PAS domain S-box-containing protein